MNTNKTNGLSTRTKIWMGVGAYVLTAGLCNVANAATIESPSDFSQKIASEIGNSGDTFTSSKMLQVSTDDDRDGTIDDDKKDEGGESGEGGEG